MSGSATNNQMATPFDFVLNDLSFITSAGQTVDLRAIFVELNIYQDLFSTVMSGSLIVTDSTNIFAYIVQQGAEFLHVSLDKPGLSAPIDRTFRVYNRNPIPNSPSNQTIKLNFCSEELMISKSLSFSKMYASMLVSDMAKDIAQNQLKLTNMPDTNIEPTTGIQTLSISYLNPLQALNWLSSKATSNYVGASYLFYENTTGYNFQSLQHLMDVSSPVAVYNYSVKNIADNNSNLDFYDVSKYYVIKTPDSLESLVTGRNSGRLLTLDVLRQKFTIGELNADDLFNSSVTLGNAPAYNNFQNRRQEIPADSYGGYRKFYPTNKGQNQASYIQGKTQIDQTNVENWLIERNAQIMQLLGNRIKIVIPGNIKLKAGDVIQFNVPSIEPQVGPNEGETMRKLDPYMTGLWLTTAIRHHVTIRMFESVLELCRDSIQQAYPSAQNQNSTVKGFA